MKNAVDDFLPGDIVTCRVSGLLPHVMIVSDQVGTNGVPLVIHNIGEGTKEESYLLANIVEGHFRCSSVGQWSPVFSPSRQYGALYGIIGGMEEIATATYSFEKLRRNGYVYVDVSI